MMTMKKSSRVALAAILSCALVFSMSIGALATGVISAAAEGGTPTVTLSDKGGAVSFTTNRSDANDNLFDSFKAVMPGDTLSQTVTVETLAGNSYDYHIYLYARQHPSVEPEHPNPQALASLSEEEEADPYMDTAQQDESFWEQLTLTVTIDGKVVTLMEAGEGTAGVYLGRFNKSGDSNDISVTLRVPIEMDNKFANANAQVDWFFYAQSISSGGGGGGGGSGGGSGGTTLPPVIPPEVELPDEDVPLGGKDPDAGETPDGAPNDPTEEVALPNEAVPLGALIPTGDIPQTGDNSPLALWATLSVLSGGTLVFLLTGLKRKD